MSRTGKESSATRPVTRAGETGNGKAQATSGSWRLLPGPDDDRDDSLDAHFLACELCSSGDDACPEGERLMALEMGLDE